MATILDLPEEILLLIFKQLWPSKPFECQKVCRSWYFPAHTVILHNVDLSFSEIGQFIASIDHNSNPSYLKSVKKINIRYRQQHVQPLLTMEMIEKLFFRFPNLKDVAISDPSIIFDEFNDDVCRTLLRNCPKLDKFELNFTPAAKNQEVYFASVYKLRLILTSMNTRAINLRSEILLTFIRSFPRLQNLWGVSGLNNFQKLLPALVHLPNLRSICLPTAENDAEYFDERYLALITKEEQGQLAKTLSRVTRLTMIYNNTFCVNSTKFMIKYFTGLHYVTLSAYNNQNLTNSQKSAFLNHILDLFCSIKNDGRVDFNRFKIADLPEHLPAVISKVFHKVQSNRVLCLDTLNDLADHPRDLIDITLMSKNSPAVSRQLKIIFSQELSLDDIAASIFEKIPTVNNVDKLILDINQQCTPKTNTHSYDNILKAMPSLKKLVFDIPASYDENSLSTQDSVYPLIEEATFRTMLGEHSQTLLDRYSFKFPNLKSLDIYYFTGTWNAEFNGFHLSLSNYSLEGLCLDLTPVKTKMEQDLEKKKVGFLVIQVTILSSNEDLLYKFSLEHCITERISGSSLDNSICGRDFYRVHVTINSLRHLDAHLCFTASRFRPYYERGDFFFHPTIFFRS